VFSFRLFIFDIKLLKIIVWFPFGLILLWAIKVSAMDFNSKLLFLASYVTVCFLDPLLVFSINYYIGLLDYLKVLVVKLFSLECLGELATDKLVILSNDNNFANGIF